MSNWNFRSIGSNFEPEQEEEEESESSHSTVEHHFDEQSGSGANPELEELIK
jgi:hypothetical protein